MNYTKISRELIKSLEFRDFTQNDYYGFAGVSGPKPMLAELESEGIVMILDGDYAELYAFDGDGSCDCVDTCENIRELPFKTEKQIRIEAEIAKLQEAIAGLKKELV
jgi:hypothetical protein